MAAAMEASPGGMTDAARAIDRRRIGALWTQSPRRFQGFDAR